MDVHTPEQRSFNMSRIKSRDTKPEKIVRSLLHRLGYRFRLHVKKLPGCPDIVLPRYKTIIYVHGCFWHRHSGCRYTTTPMSNSDTWAKKFQENVIRDKKNSEEAKRLGWRPIIIWECEIHDSQKLQERLVAILE